MRAVIFHSVQFSPDELTVASKPESIYDVPMWSLRSAAQVAEV